jgi:hypothetical protein
MLCKDGLGRECEAWQIPPSGERAREEVPGWLVRGITDRTIRFNLLGGLSLHDGDGALTSSSLPGDYLVRDCEDDGLTFWDTEAFRNVHTHH